MSEIIEINDRVLLKNTPIDEDPVYGTIEDMYASMSGIVYIVRLDNKHLVKLLRDQFKLVQDEKKDPDTITINREDYRKVVIDVVSKLALEASKKELHLMTVTSLLGTKIGADIERALFDND